MFGVVDEPLASRVVVHLKVRVSKRQLVCKFDIVARKFLLMFCFYYCLYTLSKFYLLFFLSYHFTSKWLVYTKYFGLPYSIDVVSNASNDIHAMVSISSN